MKQRGAKKAPEGERLYSYEFPKEGAPWPMKKTGTVAAASKAEARKKLVKKGVLEPFESKVTQITPVQAE